MKTIQIQTDSNSDMSVEEENPEEAYVEARIKQLESRIAKLEQRERDEHGEWYKDPAKEIRAEEVEQAIPTIKYYKSGEENGREVKDGPIDGGEDKVEGEGLGDAGKTKGNKHYLDMCEDSKDDTKSSVEVMDGL